MKNLIGLFTKRKLKTKRWDYEAYGIGTCTKQGTDRKRNSATVHKNLAS